jgi:hypothetical protein
MAQESVLNIRLGGIEVAKTNVQEFSQIIAENKVEQKKLLQQINELNKTEAKNGSLTEKQIEQRGELTAKLQAYRTQTTKLTRDMKANQKMVDSMDGSLDQLSGLLTDLTSQYRNLSKAERESAQGQELLTHIRQTSDELKEAEKAMGDNRRNVGNYGEALSMLSPKLAGFAQAFSGIEGTLNGLTESFKSMGKVSQTTVNNVTQYNTQISQVSSTTTNMTSVTQQAGGAFKGIGTAIMGAARAAMAFIATPIGAAIAALAAIGGITKKFMDYNAEVEKSNALISGITNQTGEVVDNIRIKTQAMSEVLGITQEELTNKAKVLVEQFGITYEEALSQMETGILATNGANEEFMQSIGEYSTFFSQAGYSVEEFANIVNAGFDLGMYADKLPDAIKEADISLREMTQGTRDALVNAFGDDFTNEIASKVNSGAITTKEALELIAEESENVVQKNGEIGLSSQQAAQLTADVFRGAGEDAGGALAIFEAVNVSMEDQTSQLDEQGKRLQENIAREQKVAEARDKAMNSPGIRAFSKALKDIGAVIQQVFFFMVERVGKNINFFIVQPIQRGIAVGKAVVSAFVNIGKGIGKLIMKFEPFNKAVTKVKDGFNSLVNGFKQGFATVRATLDGLSAYGKAVLGSLGDALDAIGKGQFKKAKNAIADIGDEGAKAFDKAFNKSMDSAMGKALETVEDAGDSMIKNMGDAGDSAGQEFKDKFAQQYDELMHEIERRPALTEASNLIGDYDEDLLEHYLTQFSEKVASGEWAESTMVQLRNIHGELSGISVTSQEFFDLAQARARELDKASSSGSSSRSRRREQERREAEKALQDEQKRIEMIQELGRTEREELKFKLDQQLSNLKIYFDESTATAEEIAEFESTLTESELMARRQLQHEYNMAIKKMDDDANKATQEATEAHLEKMRELYEGELEDRQDNLTQLMNDLQIAMNSELMAVEGNEQAKQEIRDKYQKLRLKAEMDATQELIDFVTQQLQSDLDQEALGLDLFSDEQVAEMKANLQELIVQMSDLKTQYSEINYVDETPKSIGEMLGMDEEGIATAQLAFQTFTQGMELVSQALAQQTQNQMLEIGAQRKEGLISEEEFQNKRQAIEQKAALQTHRMRMLNASVSIAKGVMEAYLSTLGQTGIFGLPLAGIAAGIAGAFGAAQLAVMQANKPKFAEGGILKGASHAQGGIQLFGSGGSYYGEAEGGEAILTRGVMQNPKLARMASALNVMGGGVPLFQGGGVLHPIQPASSSEKIGSAISQQINQNQPVLVVEQLRERENTLNVVESLKKVR